MVLRLMGEHAPILMLGGSTDGDGSRWTIHGHPVEPAIAVFLMRSGLVADGQLTELGARTLRLTQAGIEFRAAGERWWAELSPLQKLEAMITG